MATKKYLAVDLGAESGRTVLGSYDGQVLSLQETHRFANHAESILGTSYWDTLSLWRNIQDGIGHSVDKAGEAPVSLSVDTWGVDFALIGPDGQLVAQPVQYRDPRTDGMMEKAFSMVPKEDIFNVTGLQFLKINTLYQLLAISQGPGNPWARAQTLLFMPDLFQYFLTGLKQTEATIASTSQLLDAKSQQWSEPLLQSFGIPSSMMPDLVGTGTQLGGLMPEVERRTGAQGTQVIAGAGHDTAAAVAGVPAQGDDWLFISSGTWSLMGADLPAPVLSKQTLQDNFTNEAGVGGTSRYLKNIMGLWLVQQCRRQFELDGNAFTYDELTRQAQSAPAFGSIVNPDDNRFINPDNMVDAMQRFFIETGQTKPDSPGGFVRSALESLALRYRRTLEQLESNLERKFSTIHIVGGGAQNELLCQMTADCCERTVVAGPVEATAAGNILVQMLATGELQSLQEGRQMVANSFPTKTFEPVPSDRWKKHEERFLQLPGV